MPRSIGDYSPIVNLDIDGVSVPGFTCSRCSHVWIPYRTVAIPPIACPNCHSPYWAVPKWKFRKSIKRDV